MAKRFYHVYRFKITIFNIKPAIWRRLEVPENYTFWDFHVAIQDVMGWTDSHLHRFDVRDPRTHEKFEFSIPLFEEEIDFIPDWEEKIANYFTMENRSVVYEYDFGDSWFHRILLEQIHPIEEKVKYPICLGGKRACPPEDCGGIGGYYNLLQILKEPTHEEYKSMKMWVGDDYDPEYFDPATVHFDNPEERLDLLFQ
jgi:hypothetical protein